MRIVVILLFGLIFLGIPNLNLGARAQFEELTPEKALADYNYTYDQYRQSYSAYLVSKNEYLTYNTLTAKQKAIDSAKATMTWRIDVVKTYLTALRTRLLVTPGLLPADYIPLVQIIDSDLSWADTHRQAIPSAGTAKDLTDLSKKFEEKYSEIENAYYQVLITILAGHQNSLQSQITNILVQIKSRINQATATGTNTDILNRWLVTTSATMDRAAEKHTQAIKIITRYQAAKSDALENPGAGYSQAQSLFVEENLYFQQTVNSLEEVIREAARLGL